MGVNVNKSVIFHHPGPLFDEPRSGSQVRPFRMLQAMRQMGYEVENVSGPGKTRSAHIRKLVSEIKRGRHFDFVYSESRSIPTLLAEDNRLPVWPLYDLWFLRFLKKAGVPVGLFYRDVFWRFPRYHTMIPKWGGMITKPLYWLDWWWYCRYVDHLFLPSEAMAVYLPSQWEKSGLTALPPGSPAVGLDSLPLKKDRGVLRILYIGGINPPGYDISRLFALARDSQNVHLTVCCRESEWRHLQNYYHATHLDKNIKIVHLVGSDALKLYEAADIFCILWPKDEYLDFAVPVKLFEAIGHGIPVVTYAGSEVARIVERESTGWVVEDDEQLRRLIDDLCNHPETLGLARLKVYDAAKRNTWNARVEKAASTLGSVHSRPSLG